MIPPTEEFYSSIYIFFKVFLIWRLGWFDRPLTGMQPEVMPPAMPVRNRPNNNIPKFWADPIIRRPRTDGTPDSMMLSFLPSLSFITMALSPPKAAPMVKMDWKKRQISSYLSKCTFSVWIPYNIFYLCIQKEVILWCAYAKPWYLKGFHFKLRIILKIRDDGGGKDQGKTEVEIAQNSWKYSKEEPSVSEKKNVLNRLWNENKFPLMNVKFWP